MAHEKPTLKNTAASGAISLLRCYVRYAPISIGKVYLFKRVLAPLLNKCSYASVVKTTFGAKMAVKFPDVIQMWIFYFGIWEPRLTKFITGRLQKGDCFVDVGSNIGYFSLLASKLVGSEGKVFAIEASPKIFSLLSQNINFNKRSNIETFNVAATDFHGRLNIYMADEDNIGHSTTIPSIAESDGHRLEASVPAMPLPDIVGIDRLLKARIIKIDVEGAEISVIRGIQKYLKKFSDCTEWVIEITPDGTKGKIAEINELLENFRNAGYYLYKLVNDCDIQTCISPPSNYSLTPIPELKKPFDLLASKQIRDGTQNSNWA